MAFIWKKLTTINGKELTVIKNHSNSPEIYMILDKKRKKSDWFCEIRKNNTIYNDKIEIKLTKKEIDFFKDIIENI